MAQDSGPAAADALYSARSRRNVNMAAGLTALGVVVVATLLIFLSPAAEQRDSKVTTTDVTQDVQSGTSPSVTVTHTVAEEIPATDTSPIGQLLATPGAAVLLNVGLVLLAAFLAGAVIQRVALGEYGVTVGPVEIPQLPAIPPEKAAGAVARITSSPQFVGLIRLEGKWRGAQPIPQFFDVRDPRLQFLSIRIELEQRLRELARSAGIESELTLDRLLGRLQAAQVIDPNARRGLQELLSLGDQAAAGAEVSEETLNAVEDSALSVLYALGELRRALDERRAAPNEQG